MVMATPELIEETMDTIKYTALRVTQPLYEKYDELPGNGKFGVGAVGGYIATKLSIRTTVTAAKYTGAAFILSEVMNQAGLLDRVAPSGNGDEMLFKVKRKVTKTVNDCRLAAKKHLSYETFKSGYETCVKKDKMGTLGLTTGAVAGLVF
jgi:hypothetical protein